MRRYLILICLLVIGCGVEQGVPEGTSMVNEEVGVSRVVLSTEDGMGIVASHYAAPSEVGIILLHQLNLDRHSYDEFVGLLKEYNTISIDFRGHGESDGDWKEFSDDNFIAMQRDVAAAKNALRESGSSKFVIIGASIGANSAINFGAKEDDVIGVGALSPGLVYRGIRSEHLVSEYTGNLLIVVSDEDQYSYESSQHLFEASSAVKELKVYQNAGHGTNMFENTDLKVYLVQWVRKVVG
ncbi:hypothetical protein CMO92_03745 [Candidatus Woesearchaeota archaeon]|nr:hypothetical protein [Candidatus Woesearchaeota archaeon]